MAGPSGKELLGEARKPALNSLWCSVPRERIGKDTGCPGPHPLSPQRHVSSLPLPLHSQPRRVPTQIQTSQRTHDFTLVCTNTTLQET